MASETRRAFVEDGPNRTHIGGQALIEGVMMRGKQSWAAAVRQPDGGVYLEERALSSKGSRPAWMSWPLVRGCVSLVDSLVLGFRALEVATAHAYDEEGNTYESLRIEKVTTVTSDNSDGAPSEDEGSRGSFRGGVEGYASSSGVESVSSQGDGPCSSEAMSEEEASVEKGPAGEPESFFGKAEMALSIVLGLALGIGLFIFLPAFVSNVLIGDYDVNPLAWNLVDGVLRVAVFVFYVWLIGFMPDIKRMFCYHGAEHKAIHCFEHGVPLTPENAACFPRLHVRCGTAFLVMVMVLAILVYTLVPVDQLIAAWGITDSIAKFVLVIVSRIALMPVIAGVTYEVTVRWAGSNPDNPLVRVVLWPGMQMQRLTTKEPDAGMLECAIAALEAVHATEEASVADIGRS